MERETGSIPVGREIVGIGIVGRGIVGKGSVGRGSVGKGSVGKSCGAAKAGTVATARMTKADNEERREDIRGMALLAFCRKSGVVLLAWRSSFFGSFYTLLVTTELSW